MDSTPFHLIKNGLIYELEPDPDGGFVISVPALPGCVSHGQTIDEAMEMISEAMEGWLEVATEEGIPIPAHLDARRAS